MEKIVNVSFECGMFIAPEGMTVLDHDYVGTEEGFHVNCGEDGV